MRVVIERGVEGAARARGVAVVIDVFRAFTVSAYALAAGATECLLVREVAEALAAAQRIPGAVVSAEVDGMPVPGIPISNSPSMVATLDLRGKVLIQRTSAGTQAAAAAMRSAEAVFASSLVTAGATVAALLAMDPPVVTLVASGLPDHVEDAVCADLLRERLLGQEPDAAARVDSIRRSRRYGLLEGATIPGFPAADLDLALEVDRFRFAQPVSLEDGALHLRAAAQSTP